MVFEIYDTGGVPGLMEAYPVLLNLNMRLEQDIVLEGMYCIESFSPGVSYRRKEHVYGR